MHREILAQAWHHYAQGEFRLAESLCLQVIGAEPNNPEAWSLFGVVAFRCGRAKEAIESLDRAIALAPTAAVFRLNRGGVLHGLRQFAEAEKEYRDAIRLDSNQADAFRNLGLLLFQQRRLEESVTCCQRALEIRPQDARIHEQLGDALREQGKLDEAARYYRRALQISPEFAVPHNSLGSILYVQGMRAEAARCFERALEINPNYVEALNNRANALKEEGLPTEAAAYYRRLMELKPGWAIAHSNFVYCEQYRPGVTLARLASLHAEWDREHAQPLRGTWQPHRNSHDPNRTLRLGFISADFRLHALAYSFVSAFECLRGRQCETYCYWNHHQSDEMTGRIKRAATHWREVANVTNDDLVQQIRTDQIDILFDLDGHTAGNRLLVFARKPAPIQITWIGYVGTTGLNSMDYLLADRWHVPREAEQHIRERVLRLPDGYVCHAPDLSPAIGPLPAIKASYVTFGSFNKASKINESVIETWSTILRRVPEAKLLLKFRGLAEPETRQRYEERFATHGIGPDRLELLGPSPRAKLLDEYNRIDVALDPFPFSGCLTTCEALWMGIPVLTLPGETFAGRASLSHLSNIGLTETIAQDLPHYVELAVELANDWPRLARWRAELRNRMAQSPLCDAPRFADNLMRTLRGVWTEWCAAQASTAAPAEATHDTRTAHTEYDTANSLAAQGRPEDAVEAYRRVDNLEPTHFEAANKLGTVLEHLGRLEEATAAFQQALDIEPQNPSALANLGIVLRNQGRHDEAMATFMRAVESRPTNASAHSQALMCAQYLPDVSLSKLADAHADWNAQHAASFQAVWQPHGNSVDPDRPIRLGFVSPDFCFHPVGLFLVRALEGLALQGFKTVCYSDSPAKDGLTTRLAAASSLWHDIIDWPDDALDRQVRADGIDVLFDLVGHASTKNRLLVFARKPAPIQITWIGYVGTTGLAAMDYLIADRFEVLDGAEHYYTEKVLRLPDDYICFTPFTATPDVGPLPASKHGHVTFGSFNNPAKINSSVIALWSEVLRSVPDAKLVLKYRSFNDAATRRRFAKMFGSSGVSADRIDLQGSSHHGDMMTAYNQIDLALDPFPYSGGFTTCEALWMGVPVITCPGETFASRHSLSHLSNANVSGTIARDFAEYVQLAAAWSQDVNRLADLRVKLRDQVRRSPLCDGERFAANLAGALRSVWRTWCARDSST